MLLFGIGALQGGQPGFVAGVLLGGQGREGGGGKQLRRRQQQQHGHRALGAQQLAQFKPEQRRTPLAPAQPRAAQCRQRHDLAAVGGAAQRRQPGQAGSDQHPVQRRVGDQRRTEGEEQIIPEQQFRPQPGGGGQVFEQPQRTGFRDKGVQPPPQCRRCGAGPVSRRPGQQAAEHRKQRQRHQGAQQPADRRGGKQPAHRHPAGSAEKVRQRLHAARKIPEAQQQTAASHLGRQADRPEQYKQPAAQQGFGGVAAPQAAAGGPHHRRAAVNPVLGKDRHGQQKGKQQHKAVGNAVPQPDLSPVGGSIGNGQAVQRRVLFGGAPGDLDVQPAAAGKDGLAELVGPLRDLLQIVRVGERPLGLVETFLQNDPLLGDAAAEPQRTGFAQGGQILRRVAAVGQHPQRHVPHRLVRGLLQHQQRHRDIQRILPGREVGRGLGRRAVGVGRKDRLLFQQVHTVGIRGQRPAEGVEHRRQQQKRPEQQEGAVAAELAQLADKNRPHSAAPLFSLS